MNRASAARQFVAAAPADVISKLFVNGLVEQGRSMVGHAHLLTAADLADLRGIEVTAHQLQHFVNKRYDLRVVVVGERLFAVAIHPTSPAARIDFRADYRALRHERVELPTTVQAGVRALMTELGLVFGCMDLVVDQAGEHHFLEINPTGQFGWLEGAVGVPITAALADMLAQPTTPKQGRSAA